MLILLAVGLFSWLVSSLLFNATASVSSLAEFEAALSTVEWLGVIDNYSTTEWCTDGLPQWALGSAYSQHKHLLQSTLLTTSATNFYEPVLQVSLHYTPKEVLLTLAAACVYMCPSANRSGFWKREDIVQEFAWPDGTHGVTGSPPERINGK